MFSPTTKGGIDMAKQQTIHVAKDGKKWKVTVNQIQQGAALSSPILANREATQYQIRYAPQAKLELAPVPEVKS
jgi:hypothetical protein